MHNPHGRRRPAQGAVADVCITFMHPPCKPLMAAAAPTPKEEEELLGAVARAEAAAVGLKAAHRAEKEVRPPAALPPACCRLALTFRRPFAAFSLS